MWPLYESLGRPVDQEILVTPQPFGHGLLDRNGEFLAPGGGFSVVPIHRRARSYSLWLAVHRFKTPAVIIHFTPGAFRALTLSPQRVVAWLASHKSVHHELFIGLNLASFHHRLASGFQGSPSVAHTLNCKGHRAWDCGPCMATVNPRPVSRRSGRADRWVLLPRIMPPLSQYRKNMSWAAPSVAFHTISAWSMWWLPWSKGIGSYLKYSLRASLRWIVV